MAHELFCSWFGLEAGDWPPDHYRLLGLPQGADDAALIEQRVHQKLDEVRRYQCMHPGPATEAMNRIALAFVCLTDASQKRAYDDGLPGARPRAVPPPVPPAAPKPPATPPPVPATPPHLWLYTPGVPAPGEAAAPVAVAVVPEVFVEEPPPPPAPMPAAPPRDLVAESARRSQEATRGLSSRRALFARIARTRRLMRLWEQMGKYLKDPEARLTRAQAAEAHKLVKQAEEAMADFPLLGEAGQPGYLIVTLTRLDKSKALTSLQSTREALARDWAAGQTFLDAHRDYLRDEARKQRKRGLTERWGRTIRALLNEQPLAIAAVLAGIAALSIAVIKSLP